MNKMKDLKIQIDDELHKVVYIDYSDGIPHRVETICFIEKADRPYWRLNQWDFFANDGDKRDIRAYNAASGGDENDIYAPQCRDGYIGEYWIADDIVLNGEPKNAKRLDKPRRIKGYYGNTSINPFKIAEITDDYEYCERCGHNSVDFCREHKYTDDEGNDRYIDNDEYCD